MVHIVKTQYKTGDYIDEAERTASTAYAELVWAEASVRRVTKVVTAVSNTALEKVRQSKYKLADTYVREQRSLYEAAIAEKQAAIVSENEFVQLLMRILHGTEQGD